MPNKTIHIKNMVCNRCIWAVERELKALGLNPLNVVLGTAIIEGDVEEKELEAVDLSLRKIGFELIDNKKSQVVEKIKNEIVKYIHYDPELIGKLNFSDFISHELGYDYSYLSSLFSTTEGITIEKYVILQRIERAKELLIYDELSLKEIAYQMGYSSVQHLSNQFKKVTGLTPSFFKKIKENKRRPLDEV